MARKRMRSSGHMGRSALSIEAATTMDIGTAPF
jgi:hypothetical protein